MNFWGRPTGSSTVSWKYQGSPWEVVRPDDGQPATRHAVRCRVCDKELTFTAHSVAATRRRQARWRVGAWGGLVLTVATLVAVVTGSAPWALLALPFAVALAWNLGTAAAEEVGVTGHGNGVPWSMPKHAITLADQRPEDLPELVCSRCGHQEHYRWGSHLREGYVREQYQAARTRFERHTCR
ncbi:hypothetical protein [Streptomyces sp. B6B3]|uniref:hypothetical protein n=1 Tax=Streptomyces sp. B6B3 TaxID=3153570 RepID=UPI00325EC82E